MGLIPDAFRISPGLLREQRVPVVDQILLVLQETRELVRQIPGLLEHPVTVGLLDDSHDLYFARGVVDAHQDHVPGQPGQRQGELS